jgi:tetratricopeptide (TPR) repeat protein
LRFRPPTSEIVDTCNSKPCLEEELKADSNNVEVLWSLGKLFQSEYNYQKATELFSKAIQIDSFYNYGYLYRDRANCKNNLHNDTGAIKDMDRAIRLDSGNADFYIDRALYLYNVQKLNLALNDYSKALNLYNNSLDARLGRAKIYVQLNKFDQALSDYTKISESKDYSAYDYYYRGIARFKTNQTDSACSDWQKAAVTCTEAKDSLNKICNRGKNSR